MKRLLVTSFLVVFCIGSSLSAAIKENAFSGGVAKSENDVPLSLLKFEKDNSRSGERLSLTLGNKNGVALDEPGFFQVAVDEGGTRVVLDLSQVQQTSVDQNDLKSVLKNSSLVRSAEITMDPVDKSTNITFLMKKPVLAKATSNKANGKVFIDLQEVK